MSALKHSLPARVSITAGLMGALILLVYFLNIPNPNMILIAGLVICSALFGFAGGIVASLTMFAYTLFFFSIDHSFTHYTSVGMQKVVVSFVGIIVDMLFVCFLKEAETNAFAKVEELHRKLIAENEMLQHMSRTDALTGIPNRLALYESEDSYAGHDVAVVMIDLNSFKQINDTLGHVVGDRLLKETAALLVRIFGREHCFRYGGDEFLIVVPDMAVEDYGKKIEALRAEAPEVDSAARAEFSVGFVHAVIEDKKGLITLIAQADKKMYEEKRAMKRARTPARISIQPLAAVQEKPAVQPEPAERAKEMPREYTVGQMKAFLKEMAGKYDLARVVDPVECRILDLQDDGKINISERCYSIWNSGQKCLNCSSATACRTGSQQSKTEHFRDRDYFIQSEPVTLKLDNGSDYRAVVELVNVGNPGEGRSGNDREAENIGSLAAHYRAHHDILTNVLNPDAFYELSRGMIKASAGLSWVMITSNIRNYRLINTLFGVLKGNEVLVRTASKLREFTGQAGGLCGRLGGDQFALLVPGDKFREQALLSIAQSLSSIFNNGIYTFCIHFGVYEVEDPEIPVSVMCGRANSALSTIRDDLMHNVAYFDENIQQKLLLEQKVIGGLEQALKEGQIRMHLQPLVDQTGRVIGAEALARWVCPDGTIIMPGDFIETLEQAGLIHKLDVRIWELAVMKLSEWKNTDKDDLTISVNMSAKDFFSIDVYETLTTLADRYGVQRGRLRLEITETALLVEPEKTGDIVSRLRQAGFIVEIDDFGKGYSSLGLLKNIRADILKIDMSFLHEIHNKERSRIILQSVIGMAGILGMDVITEGVESVEQLEILTKMGCRHFQGYYFSRPIPVDKFEARISESRTLP
jgi:diguanylate cyclase (GGDEF)-like protein